MKKFLLVIPIVFISFNITNINAGPQIWTQDLVSSSGVWQHAIVINPTNDQIMYAGTNGAGVYKSTNGGLIWLQVNTGLTNLGIFCLEISKSNPNVLYAGTIQTGASPGVYVTTNAGTSWTFVNTGITESSIAISSVAIDPTNPSIAYITVFDGLVDATQGIFKTTNMGGSWTVANTGIGAMKNFLSLIINPLNPNVLYAGTSFGVVSQTGPVHIYRSNNGAASWTDMSNGLPPLATDLDPVRDMSINAFDTSRVLAGLFQNTVAGGAFVTTNGGGSWTRMSTGIPNLVAFQIRAVLIKPGSSTEFYAGTDPGTSGGAAGVYRTTDGGSSWVAFNGGLMTTTSVVRSLAFRSSDLTLFAGVAGTSGFGVYEYTFPPVGISGNENTPKSFSLSQNYPNPFNPSTVIQYAVPKASLVTIKVYDMTGREIKTLVNDFKNAGTFEVRFNASNLASGVYFYKIQAGEFRDTKKMMLVK